MRTNKLWDQKTVNKAPLSITVRPAIPVKSPSIWDLECRTTLEL